MTAEKHSAAAQPDPAPAPAARIYSPRQQRPGGHTSRDSHAPARTGADPVRDDRVVAGLVTRARSGDQQAWDALVDRYAPLIWSICRRHQLDPADAEAAGQQVWLQLVDQIGTIREPAALGGWLATTTRRECLKVLRAAQRSPAAAYAPDPETLPGEEELLTAERHAALLEAFEDLPPRCQQLIALLAADPPVPYAEISARLGIPVGSIGPNRRRCLDKLRRHPAIAALIHAGNITAGDCRTAAAGPPGHQPPISTAATGARPPTFPDPAASVARKLPPGSQR